MAEDSNNGVHYGFRLYLYTGGRGSEFGPGIAALLRGVEETGSLLQAANRMGMAYSKAWKSINQVEERFGLLFLARETGRGHGSVLTEQGQAFLAAFDAFSADLERAAAKSFAKRFAFLKNS